jgi:hypothetical protein
MNRALAKAVGDTKGGPKFPPGGAWPRRLDAAYSAGYCGEPSVRAFLKRVGVDKDYPLPCVKEGRRVLWLKDDLDKAIAPEGRVAERDVALDF